MFCHALLCILIHWHSLLCYCEHCGALLALEALGFVQLAFALLRVVVPFFPFAFIKPLGRWIRSFLIICVDLRFVRLEVMLHVHRPKDIANRIGAVCEIPKNGFIAQIEPSRAIS